MKKLLLSTMAVASFVAANAQTTVFMASSAADYGTFTVIDADQDGKAWGLYDLTGAGTTFDAQGEIPGSNSWDTVALTPDNWLISPAIDLTGMTSCSLSFGRAAVDAGYPAENYSVYVVTGADLTAAVTAMATATAVYTETIVTGDEWLVRSADISALDNTSNVYVGVRHHGCTDQYILMVDDITVSGTGTPVSVVEGTPSANTYVYDNNLYVMSSQALDNSLVTITNMMGELVATYNVTGNSFKTELSDLSAGIYLVTLNGATTKIVVK